MVVRTFILAALVLLSAQSSAEVFYRSVDKFGDPVISNRPSPGSTRITFNEPAEKSTHQVIHEEKLRVNKLKQAQHDRLIAKIVYEHALMRRTQSHAECLRQVKKLELIKKPGTYFSCRYLDVSAQEAQLNAAEKKLADLQNHAKTSRN